MPHLSRRAVENKSVLGAGGAVRERTEAAALIWKKMNVIELSGPVKFSLVKHEF
jgi:hypothetical protein